MPREWGFLHLYLLKGTVLLCRAWTGRIEPAAVRIVLAEVEAEAAQGTHLPRLWQLKNRRQMERDTPLSFMLGKGRKPRPSQGNYIFRASRRVSLLLPMPLRCSHLPHEKVIEGSMIHKLRSRHELVDLC